MSNCQLYVELTRDPLELIPARPPPTVHLQIVVVAARIPILHLEIQEVDLQLAYVVPGAVHRVPAPLVVAVVPGVVGAGDPGDAVPHVHVARPRWLPPGNREGRGWGSCSTAVQLPDVEEESGTRVDRVRLEAENFLVG